MKPNTGGSPPFDPYLDDPINRQEAAAFSKHALITLDVMRPLGKGPRFLKPPGSKRVLYTRRAILTWLQSTDVAPPAEDSPQAKLVECAGPATGAKTVHFQTEIKITDTEVRCAREEVSDD